MDEPIERAAPAELRAILGLLSEAGLPAAGFAEHIGDALVVRSGGRLLGCVAVEAYGEEALLRSLAVSPEARGNGLGERLTRAALELARRRGARRLFLLTTTAERFFPRFGFRRVPRQELPTALAPSAELRGACPASAVALRIELEPDAG